MKKVVWGTGWFAGKFMATHDAEEIEFFIDSDREKTNKLFLGKRIVHPDQIRNWKEIYIFVPFNYYEEISLQLKTRGLREDINFTKYIRGGYISEAEAERDYRRSILELEQQKENMAGKYLFWGHSWNETKGYKKILSQLQQHDKNVQFAFISEEVWLDKETVGSNSQLPAIVTPKIFDTDIYIKESQERCRNSEDLCRDAWFKERSEHLQSMFPDDVNATLMTQYLYGYICNVIDKIQPKGIFALASVSPSHTLLGHVCKVKQVPVLYTHPGILPGTNAIDALGEMGESLPALYPEKFKKLPVSDQEITEAKRIWDFLKTSGLNRKIQPKISCKAYIRGKLKKDRPILFYAGQNDANSHMVPYTENTQKYHSPIFKSSLESAIYLADLCKKNDWNYIYKPHPYYIQDDPEKALPNNTIYIETGDINELIDISDVIVTILSQTNYIALIRHKPVVMLGYNQIKGKGCTYEAFERSEIESVLIEAFKNGFTKEQEEAFLIHIAQIVKYYLYDDMKEREIRFGQAAPHKVDGFYTLQKLLTERDGE